MQPQGPYGQNGQPPYPQGPPQGPTPYGPPGPQFQHVQSGQPYPAAPGQQFQPGQPGTTPPQPTFPGQPPVPAYQMPQSLKNQPGNPVNLPPEPAAPSTPYDFFMQPKPQQASRPLPENGRHFGNIPGTGAPPPKKNKFILVAGGGIVLVILLFAGVAMIPKDPTGPQLVSIAQTQQEIIRVCTLGSKAKFQSTRNFAVTCATGVSTNQGELLAYIQKQNFEYNPKLLGSKSNAQVDAKLKTAQSASTYDAVFRDTVKAQLASYNRSLQTQLAVTEGVNAREILTKSQRSVELLNLMVADDSDKTEALPDTSATPAE